MGRSGINALIVCPAPGHIKIIAMNLIRPVPVSIDPVIIAGAARNRNIICIGQGLGRTNQCNHRIGAGKLVSNKIGMPVDRVSEVRESTSRDHITHCSIRRKRIRYGIPVQDNLGIGSVDGGGQRGWI